MLSYHNWFALLALVAIITSFCARVCVCGDSQLRQSKDYFGWSLLKHGSAVCVCLLELFCGELTGGSKRVKTESDSRGAASGANRRFLWQPVKAIMVN